MDMFQRQTMSPTSTIKTNSHKSKAMKKEKRESMITHKSDEKLNPQEEEKVAD